MGLIKAGIGALGGTLADQWKEFFYCESMPKEVLVTKGQKRVGSRSSNTKGSDNIISNGSGIAVADGQCMIIVEQGKVVEVCAEPGEFTYDTSTEPSIFSGKLGESIKETFRTIGKRFTYGGDTGKDQRVYYFNTKELIDNKFGTPNPIPFRVVDSKIGLDLDVSVRCSGVYSYRIADPLLFYTNVCGNVEKEYTRDELDSQLKTEFVSALQPAFGRLSELELRPNQIVTHNTDLENAMNTALSEKWGELRGSEGRQHRSRFGHTAGRGCGYDQAGTACGDHAGSHHGGGNACGCAGRCHEDGGRQPGGSHDRLYGHGYGDECGRRSMNGTEPVCHGTAATAAGTAGGTCAGWLDLRVRSERERKLLPELRSEEAGASARGRRMEVQLRRDGKRKVLCRSAARPQPADEAGWTCSCGTVNKGKFCSELRRQKARGRTALPAATSAAGSRLTRRILRNSARSAGTYLTTRT